MLVRILVHFMMEIIWHIITYLNESNNVDMHQKQQAMLFTKGCGTTYHYNYIFVI